MSDSETHLLRGIVAQPRPQIELATRSIEPQRRHLDRINSRAEAMQLRAGRIIRVLRFVLIPAALLLFATLLRPSLRYGCAPLPR